MIMNNNNYTSAIEYEKQVPYVLIYKNASEDKNYE